MEPARWQRVLVTTDFSPLAGKAVSYAHALAEKLGAELHVLHVARDISQLIAQNPATGIIDASDGLDDKEKWLAKILGDPASVRRIEVVRFGEDVAGTILGYAGQQNADLLVIATHGRTGLTHLFMGSVTEKVLRAAPCPVVVIRP
jgi:nucleotide-binding universal stress UspA family protein